ncbi:adhesion G-protein coupled receptor G6-like [Anneissia japonica]|uniref:adhesion G-protein coupled receptor G6-like n=1 Tax=Anneissia japonica TaxID=1529436 RepID=UPI001425782F|nr:adhesion G-protein coupled receptor G6-like [Anneissia japonica]
MKCAFKIGPDDNLVIIKWYKSNVNGEKGEQIIYTTNGSTRTNGRYSLSDNGDFKISNVEKNDTGYYLCRVTTHKVDLEDLSNLTVYYIETPHLVPKQRSVNENETMAFTCPLPDGFPTPINITWIKDCSILGVSDSEKYPQSNTTLEISRVNKMDEGDYQCRMENAAYIGDEGKLSNKGTMLLLNSSQTKVTTHIRTLEFSTHNATLQSRFTSTYSTIPTIATKDITSTEMATASAPTITHYNETSHLANTASNFRSTTEQNTKITTQSRSPRSTSVPNTVDYGHKHTITMTQTNATTETLAGNTGNLDTSTLTNRTPNTTTTTQIPITSPTPVTHYNKTSHLANTASNFRSTTEQNTKITTQFRSPRSTSLPNTVDYGHKHTITMTQTNATTETLAGNTGNLDTSTLTNRTPNTTTTTQIPITSPTLIKSAIPTGDATTVKPVFHTTELPSTNNIKTSAITNGLITTDSGIRIPTTILSTADSYKTVSTPFNDASVSIKFTSSSIYTKKTPNDSASTGLPGTTKLETDYTTDSDGLSTYSAITTQPRFTTSKNTVIYEHNTTTVLAQNSSDIATTTTPHIATTNSSSELLTASAPQSDVTTTIVTTENGDTEHTTTQNQVSTSLRPTTTPLTVGYEHNTTTTATRTNITTHIQTSELLTHNATLQSRFTSTYSTILNIATKDITSTETATTSAPTTTHYNITADLPTTKSIIQSSTEEYSRITTRSKFSAHETTVGNTPPTIVCPSDISSTDTSPDWEVPIASDDESPPLPAVNCTNNPGDKYPIGSITKVTCTAIYSVEQEVSCSFYITVETVLSEEIANLTKNVNDENVEEVAIELEEIAEKAELKPADVQEVSNAMDTIVNIESPNENVTNAIVGTVDAVIASDLSDIPPETTALILESFEQQISTAATDGQNYTQDEDTVSVRTLSFDSNLHSDVVFVVNEGKKPDVCFDEVCLVNAKNQSFTLPKDLLTSYEGRTNISFTSFYNPNLFQSGTAERNLSSVIMSATIYNKSLPQVFQNPVELVFNVPESYSNSNVSCVFWNATLDGNGNWSIEGCELIDAGDEGSVTCHCTHLTNFAVLFFPNEIPPGVDIFLDLVTYIGCGVSIACLILTVVTILSIPSLRKRQPQKIMVSLCVSLICLYTTFIFGVDTANPGTAGCKTVAVLLHYLLLTSVAWTAVEATNMYLYIIQVFDARKSHFMLISSTLAWGLPCVPPIVLLSIDISYYNNKKYCYLSATEVEVFIYAIIIPIGVVILCNFVIFVLIIKKVFFSSSMMNGPLDKKEKKKRLVNAIAISLLLGLTWIFGFLSFENAADIVFLILFCVFNSFQGVAIFYLFCLRQKECKQAWKNLLGISKAKSSYEFSLTRSTLHSKTANDSLRSTPKEQKKKKFTSTNAFKSPAFENTVDEEDRNESDE